MVSCQDNAVCVANSYPAGWFKCLSSFVNEERTEMPTMQQAVAGTYKSGSYHVGMVKEVGIDLDFECCSPLAQAGKPVAHGLPFIPTPPFPGAREMVKIGKQKDN